jgi:hypothetical protein
MIDNGWEKINTHLRSRMQRPKIDIKYSPRQIAHIPAVRVPARFVQQPTNHVVLSKSKRHSSHSQSAPAFNPRTTNKKTRRTGRSSFGHSAPYLSSMSNRCWRSGPRYFSALRVAGSRCPKKRAANLELSKSISFYIKKSTDRKNIRTPRPARVENGWKMGLRTEDGRRDVQPGRVARDILRILGCDFDVFRVAACGCVNSQV